MTRSPLRLEAITRAGAVTLEPEVEEAEEEERVEA